MTSFWDAVWLSNIIHVIQIALVLGGIILVHEFGHYIVAKRSGMRVDEFAIGVGPALKTWERGGTVYRVSPFLFMGYVRIRGLEGETDADSDPASFYTQPHAQRAAVTVAGAVINVVFAALLFMVLYGFWGVPDARYPIAGVIEGSAAEDAGIEAGWEIAAIDGRPADEVEDVQQVVQESGGQPLEVVLTRGSRERTVTLQPRLDPETDKYLIGVQFGDDAALLPVIARVDPGGPAAEAGLEPGDRIVAVEGEPLEFGVDALDRLSEVPEELELKAPDEVTLEPVALTVERDGAEMTVEVQPEPERHQRRKPLEEGETLAPGEDRPIEDFLVGDAGLVLERNYRRLGVAGSLREGFQRSIDTVMLVVASIAELVQGRKFDEVGGPVMIVKSLHQAAGQGWYDLLEWAGMLSIMIGVFNLLPLPALDGGRLVFIAIDWIGELALSRTLVSRRAETLVHAVGLMVLLGLMLLVSIRDLRRW